MTRMHIRSLLCTHLLVLIQFGFACQGANTRGSAGICQPVPAYFRPGTVVFGNQAQGAEGDFSCTSDVFTEHGVRISPWIYDGRAYYDFGPVEGDTIGITFQWEDNGWISELKALELFDWQTGKWKRVKSWSGNDARPHDSTFRVPVLTEEKGREGQIRVAVFASGNSVIHLNTISIK